jgi:hypothetical protein
MMKKILRETLHLTKELTQRIVVFIDKKVRSLFIEAALRPVTDAQATGLALRLKSDVATGAPERVFVPVVCLFNLDNLQAYGTQGLTQRGGVRVRVRTMSAENGRLLPCYIVQFLIALYGQAHSPPRGAAPRSVPRVC